MVVIVYPAPGPLVETAATGTEAVPGIGLLMQSARDDRTRENSALFAQYWPRPWSADRLFYPELIRELSASGYQGRWVMPAEAQLSADALRALNTAKDVVDWRARYYEAPEPGRLPRDYSQIRSLGAALVFEVSLRYGILINNDGTGVPTLGGAATLYRAESMREMWRHSEVVDDPLGAKPIGDFRADPKSLAPAIEKLMPRLARALVASLRIRSARIEGVQLAPQPSLTPVGVSSGTAVSSSTAPSLLLR